MNELTKKRFDGSIKRIYKANGIILIGAKNSETVDKFVADSINNHDLTEFKFIEHAQWNRSILKSLAYSDYHKNYDKSKFYIANMFNEVEHDLIQNLQFDRDFIYLENLKLIVVLNEDMLQELLSYGDLASTAKFIHSF